jgi:hypothetical protein
MKLLACLLCSALGAACTDDDDHGPIITQGGLPTTSGTGTSGRLSGRVCVLEDLQDIASCATDAGGGLIVTLGDSAAISDDDGSFTIDVPPGLTNVNNPTFSVTGPGIVPTAFPITLPFTGTGSVPVVDADRFARALTSNGVPLGLETGSILGTVRDGRGLLAGVTVRSTPASAFGPFFDAATSTNWGVDGTGMRGVVLIPGLTAGMVDLSFSHIAGGLTTNVAGIPVRNGGVTILDTSLQTSP